MMKNGMGCAETRAAGEKPQHQGRSKPGKERGKAALRRREAGGGRLEGWGHSGIGSDGSDGSGVYADDIVDDLHGEGTRRDDRRASEGFSGAEIELGSVPWTRDAAALDPTVGESNFRVSTAVFDGEKAFTGMEDGDPGTIDHHGLGFPQGNFRDFGQRNRLRHDPVTLSRDLGESEFFLGIGSRASLESIAARCLWNSHPESAIPGILNPQWRPARRIEDLGISNL